ncbi:MAG TPA: 4Fe-4S binding protein [Candidatus Methanomethylophilaceae archaeon]|nr:4Fe-4S binding protein [Candidatus Methanomethylophilaceae archaeon]
MSKMLTAKEIAPGAMITEPGSAMKFETGDWRSFRPVLDREKYIDCLTCWIFCPDDSIIAKDGKMEGFRLSHCKGCGICARNCPKNAIRMEPEGV